MIAVDREDRYRHIDIRILVVDMIELPASDQQLHALHTHSPLTNSPIKLLARIAQHLQLARLLAITIHAQTPHHLVHRLPAGLVVVEEVAGQKNHVDVAFFGQAHDFVEGLPAVVAAVGVSLVVADMVVCCD